MTTPHRRCAAALAFLACVTLPALAQDTPPAAPTGVWQLFRQSFDLFTVVLLIGSVSAGAFIFRSLVEIRPGSILPMSKVRAINDMLINRRHGELLHFVGEDRSFPSQVIAAALE